MGFFKEVKFYLAEKLEQAEMVGKEAVKLFPNDPTPYFNLANVMGKADRYKESEQYFLKAIQLSGNSPVAKMYANLGKELYDITISWL